MNKFQKVFRLNEAIQYRKFAPGTVKFPTSSVKDPFIQQMIKKIADANKIPTSEVEQGILHDVTKMTNLFNHAPVLYATAVKNAVENAVYKMFENSDINVPSPKFNVTTFYKLVRNIRADHDEFFPLQGFIDKRRLMNPQFLFVGPGQPKSEWDGHVTTAAATPGGQFIFNTHFMQKLLDYAHLKHIKPNGTKYVSNGGDIPDEYAYIEFLIMHEFMHYSHDDFYYQHIIPNANPKIINWVGDFRTNYLLTKSGYEPLPIGLYSDEINYDRQKSYVEMYNLVKSELEKLPQEKQDAIGSVLDGLSDDHTPGQQQGENEEVPKDATPSKIDDGDKKINGQMERSEDTDPSKREQKQKDNNKSDQRGGEPGKGTHSSPSEVDYTKVRPTFNWQTMIKRFVSTAMPKTETTYAKPSRRAASELSIARQTGAGAVKPGEKLMDYADMNLGFVFDSSGSMSSVITMAFSNAVALLRKPVFAKSQAVVYKFSGDFELYKVNFYKNQAAKVQSIDQKPKVYDMTAQAVFNQHFGAGTVFSPQLATSISQALAKKYNLIFFLDADILGGSNLTNFVNLVKQHPKGIFVIFDDRNTYIRFRQATNIATPNMTHF